MSQQNGEQETGLKVKIFKLTDRLRKKLGGIRDKRNYDEEGFLDPDNVAEADKAIEKLCAECPDAIAGYQKEMVALWEDMRDMPRSQERDDIAGRIFTLAHEIKDLGAMCGQDLEASFAESLRDYIGQTELKLDAQRVIIQAHIDALQAVQKQKLTEDDPQARELKEMVKIAIEKYS